MKVWELRSSLCAAVQEVADDCDIRALLIKPIQPELAPPPVKKAVTINNDQVSQSEAKLKAAIEKNTKAISERDRLMAEPEVGEEFVRQVCNFYSIIIFGSFFMFNRMTYVLI